MAGPKEGSGLHLFLLAALMLALLRMALGLLSVPMPLIAPLSVLVTALFVLAPFMALYVGASEVGRPRVAAILLVVGAALHAGGVLVVQYNLISGLGASAIASVSQAGLLMWCLGLGILLAGLLKDANMLVPICIFLAFFDAFLVLTPVGLTEQIMVKQPKLMPAVALAIPKVQTAPTTGPIAAAAYIGPADLLFSAFFFAALYRFSMSVRRTALWLGPTLLAYLVGAMKFGPLPALIPIGLCVLVVNYRHLRLTKEEWASTGIIAILAAGGLTWGLMQPKPRAGLSPTPAGQGAPESGGSPLPAAQDRPR